MTPSHPHGRIGHTAFIVRHRQPADPHKTQELPLAEDEHDEHGLACAKCGSWDIVRINRSALEKCFARHKYYCRSCRKKAYRVKRVPNDKLYGR